MLERFLRAKYWVDEKDRYDFLVWCELITGNLFPEKRDAAVALARQVVKHRPV